MTTQYDEAMAALATLLIIFSFFLLLLVIDFAIEFLGNAFKNHKKHSLNQSLSFKALPNKSAIIVDKKQTICFTDVRGVVALKQAESNRPDSKADFFMPEFIFFLRREGEEYNTRKGNNSSLSCLGLRTSRRKPTIGLSIFRNFLNKEANNA